MGNQNIFALPDVLSPKKRKVFVNILHVLTQDADVV